MSKLNLKRNIWFICIVFLLLVLVWLNRYSYTASSDANSTIMGWRINNFTGEGCAIQFAAYDNVKTSGRNLIYDFSKCMEVKEK